MTGSRIGGRAAGTTPRALAAWIAVVGIVAAGSALSHRSDGDDVRTGPAEAADAKRPSPQDLVGPAAPPAVPSTVELLEPPITAVDPELPEVTVPSIPPTLPSIPVTTIPPPEVPNLRTLPPNCPAELDVRGVPSGAATRSREIAGRISGACGRPVGGVCVVLAEYTGSPGIPPSQPPRYTSTGPDGTYRFTDVPDAVWSVAFGCDDGATQNGFYEPSRTFEYHGEARTEDVEVRQVGDFVAGASHRWAVAEGSGGASTTAFDSIEPGEPRPACYGPSTAYGSRWEALTTEGGHRISLDDITGAGGVLAVYRGDPLHTPQLLACVPLGSHPASTGPLEPAPHDVFWVQIVTEQPGHGRYAITDLDAPR